MSLSHGVTDTRHLELTRQLTTHRDFHRRVVVNVRNSSEIDDETKELILSDLDDNLESLDLQSAKVVVNDCGEHLKAEIAKQLDGVNLNAGYRGDFLMHIPIERSFTVTQQGRVCIGALKGSKEFKRDVGDKSI